jgi:hypothetical protein
LHARAAGRPHDDCGELQYDVCLESGVWARVTSLVLVLERVGWIERGPVTAALRIVGSFHGVDERRPAMAGQDRMTILEVVREVLRDEHADVIRESVRRSRRS